MCSAPLTVIAYLTDPPVLAKILAHLSLPTASAPLAPPRDPSQQLDLAFDDQLVDSDFVPPALHRSRAPPSSHEPQDWTIELDHDWGA